MTILAITLSAELARVHNYMCHDHIRQTRQVSASCNRRNQTSCSRRRMALSSHRLYIVSISALCRYRRCRAKSTGTEAPVLGMTASTRAFARMYRHMSTHTSTHTRLGCCAFEGVMAYIGMAYIVMAHIGMAYIVMDYIGMAHTPDFIDVYAKELWPMNLWPM